MIVFGFMTILGFFLLYTGRQLTLLFTSVYQSLCKYPATFPPKTAMGENYLAQNVEDIIHRNLSQSTWAWASVPGWDNWNTLNIEFCGQSIFLNAYSNKESQRDLEAHHEMSFWILWMSVSIPLCSQDFSFLSLNEPCDLVYDPK